MGDKKKKEGMLRWRGTLAGGSSTLRHMVAVVLLITCAALAFTQLGFAGIGYAGDYVGYIVVLLMPVALGALLLGTLWGTFIGLIAGAVLYLHATLMPLDYYELMFVTSFTSVVMFAISGFLLGILFAFVLRNDRRGARRVVYIVLVCLIVAMLYSIGFVTDVVITLIVRAIESSADFVTEIDTAQIQEQAFRAALGMGDIGMQVFLDTILMALVCCIGDLVARHALESVEHLGLRAAFGSWLAAVVAVAFMITATVGFVAITEGTLAKESEDLRGETDYLLNQLEAANNRIQSMSNLLGTLELEDGLEDDGVIGDMVGSITFADLLDGYTEDGDGIVVVSIDNLISLSDCDWIADQRTDIAPTEDPDGLESSGNAETIEDFEGIGTPEDLDDIENTEAPENLDDIDLSFLDVLTLEYYFYDDVIEAINRSSETGDMQRVIYEEGGKHSVSLDDADEAPSRMHIGYLASETRDGFTVTIIRPSEMVFSGRSSTMAWVTISSLVLLLVVFALVWRLLDRLVARRIDETNGALARITDGELDVQVDSAGTREFKSLSAGINTTVDALKGWIAEAESRMDSELAAAKAIQESALPRTFPPFPDISRFDIYASMNAAREVGGDFYDFFLIGDDCGPEKGKLGFVIADVSGKGVPAALFMMKASSEVRDRMESGMELGSAIAAANDKLCEGNDSGMFVTMWAGVLDYATGQVDYVNAGHNPPLFLQNGEWHWLEDKSGLPLGLFDGMPYETFSVACGEGDEFLLYTDGVTEAMDVDGELYGEARLETLVKDDLGLCPQELVEVVRDGVIEHALGAEQSDDITILVLEVNSCC